MSESETLTITTERVDDIPVLLAQMEQMGVPALLDEHFPTHGNWSGLSLGWVATLWLTHILSEADHRLNRVQPWAERRLETLQRSSGQSLRPQDLGDDRLADVLRALSADERWTAFERDLAGRVLRVYTLRRERVRLDSTTASSYATVTEDGLFQFGHSKDHRPDLPQLKVMLATLDPLGLPVAGAVWAGHRADDRLYLPLIERVRASLGQRGLLYVGDCKMASWDTRAGIAAGGDWYLCPLSAVQVPPESLDEALAAVARGDHRLVEIERTAATGQTEIIAQGCEWTEVRQGTVDGQVVTWEERRVLVRSLAQARAAETALRQRVAQAQAAVLTLTERRRGKPVLRDRAAAEQAVAAVLTRYRVTDLVRVLVTTECQARPVRSYAGRPPTVREERTVHLTVAVDQTALERAVERLGWRLYVTNAPAADLPLEQAVLAYRDEYLVERSLGRLKGSPLSLSPLYLTRDDHATGLVRLLTIALRVLTLLEFVIRRRLAQEGRSLAGLYAGNPKRATTQPTAERLLEAFRDLTLTIVREPLRSLWHLTPLSPLQQRLLTLLECPPDVYSRLVNQSRQPP